MARQSGNHIIHNFVIFVAECCGKIQRGSEFGQNGPHFALKFPESVQFLFGGLFFGAAFAADQAAKG